MKLLLLSCCAPCSIAAIERLHAKNVNFSVFFYNPNIQPMNEYERRLAENKRICELWNIPFIEDTYEPTTWIRATQGLENEPERGKRCTACFQLRLNRAATYAVQHGFTHFSSVLGFSKHKDIDQVNIIALAVSKMHNIPYDTTNWRENNAQHRAQILSQKHLLFRQNYCGCMPKKNTL